MRSKPSNAGASYSLPPFHAPECVLVAIALLARTGQFGQNCRGRSEVLGLTLRNFLAPFQRLPDDFVFVRAGELLQKSLATFLINERSEPTALSTAPGVQLDRKVAVINAALKRWRIPQLLRVTDTRYRQQANKRVESGKKARLLALSSARSLRTSGRRPETASGRFRGSHHALFGRTDRAAHTVTLAVASRFLPAHALSI
jgi:hypothetical protein